VFDHVTIRVLDMARSRPFYELAMTTLGFGEPASDGRFFEWEDFSISPASAGQPVTRNLHAAFVTSSREEVDRWWETMTSAGYRDDGEPGPRPEYSAEYYGGFVLDPDGNSVEAVYHGAIRQGEERIDHLWIRVRDLEAQRRFYETIAPVLGLALRPARNHPERFHVVGRQRASALVDDGRPITENVHLAFPAPDDATVEEFHSVALAARYRDNGPPGERRYHRGYYGAFVLDPDGNNVEAVCHNR
jgi:catechol 2,3-dioxygenase-like lactoylglutathione lyase family enzyme